MRGERRKTFLKSSSSLSPRSHNTVLKSVLRLCTGMELFVNGKQLTAVNVGKYI